jgi:biofilm protein TabA
MILDSLSQASRYHLLHPYLEAGFNFLQQNDLSLLADGRHTIDGERVFAIVARDQGRGRSAAPLEFHRRYLDIQYVVEGADVIGWQPLAACRHPRAPYDASRDIGFFDEPVENWIGLAAGHFAIFFPEDAHAPLAGEGAVHKIVVKVEC